MTNNFREPSQIERKIFEVLLSTPFLGRDELAEQLKNCQVRVIDKEGSLEVLVSNGTVAPVARRIPVELYANDEDGICIHVLLHVLNGKATELEFYKDDSSKIRSLPNEWNILIL